MLTHINNVVACSLQYNLNLETGICCPSSYASSRLYCEAMLLMCVIISSDYMYVHIHVYMCIMCTYMYMYVHLSLCKGLQECQQ